MLRSRRMPAIQSRPMEGLTRIVRAAPIDIQPLRSHGLTPADCLSWLAAGAHRCKRVAISAQQFDSSRIDLQPQRVIEIRSASSYNSKVIALWFVDFLARSSLGSMLQG